METFELEVRLSGGRVARAAVTRKRVRNLNLRLRPDGTLAMSVPVRTSRERAQDFLDRHAAWIEVRMRRREERSQAEAADPCRQTIPLWGTLVDTAQALGMNAGKLAALTDDELHARISRLYREQTARELPAIARALEARMGTQSSRWQLREMKTRWGSCTPGTGAIRINTRLAAYPRTCLEAVAAHELCHLAEPSHNARFHALLDGLYPENRAATALLRRSARSVAEAAKAGKPLP